MSGWRRLTAVDGITYVELLALPHGGPLTADDDVHALEGFVHAMTKASPADRPRAQHLLGGEVSAILGWD